MIKYYWCFSCLKGSKIQGEVEVGSKYPIKCPECGKVEHMEILPDGKWRRIE